MDWDSGGESGHGVRAGRVGDKMYLLARARRPDCLVRSQRCAAHFNYSFLIISPISSIISQNLLKSYAFHYNFATHLFFLLLLLHAFIHSFIYSYYESMVYLYHFNDNVIVEVK